MSHVHSLIASVVYEPWILFVDGVISQVHELFLYVMFIRDYIWFCSESCQAFFVYIEA